MDLAQTLVRSVARAFYDTPTIDTRHILIVDALVIHSALRDDDLGVLMSMNLKDLHKICGRLREDRLIAQHVRPERIEGHQHPRNRTWYYIDYRQAIDAVKWRVYTIDKGVQSNAVPEEEKKQYFCPRCGAEWTLREALSFEHNAQGWLCQRCGAQLDDDPDRKAGGHEQSTRLNSQLRFITALLPLLDSVAVPDNTFDEAFAHRREIKRDHTNPVAISVAVDDEARPTAVRGLADSGPKTVNVNITAADGPSEAEKEAERAKKEKTAQQNALPSWHTTSTVTGASYSEDPASVTAAARALDEDKKPDANSLSAKESAEVDEIFALLKKQQAEEALKEKEEDEDEDEDEEDDMFEDVGAAQPASVAASEKPPPSGDTSAADTPASDDRPSKRVKLEEPAEDGDSDDEDMAFEDV